MTKRTEAQILDSIFKEEFLREQNLDIIELIQAHQAQKNTFPHCLDNLLAHVNGQGLRFELESPQEQMAKNIRCIGQFWRINEISTKETKWIVYYESMAAIGGDIHEYKLNKKTGTYRRGKRLGSVYEFGKL